MMAPEGFKGHSFDYELARRTRRDARALRRGLLTPRAMKLEGRGK
jgi:hypothetical protein